MAALPQSTMIVPSNITYCMIAMRIQSAYFELMMHYLLRHPMSMMNVSITIYRRSSKNTAVMLLNLIMQESSTYF